METQHNSSTDHINLVKDFLKAIGEEGKTGDALEAFYAKDILQTEYPNTLTRNLTTRDLQTLKEASEKGSRIMQRQSYELVKAYESGNTVIIEAIWTATIAIPIGNIPAGGEMKAYFAQFFELEQGKIIRQRNYDCFDPFL